MKSCRWQALNVVCESPAHLQRVIKPNSFFYLAMLCSGKTLTAPAWVARVVTVAHGSALHKCPHPYRKTILSNMVHSSQALNKHQRAWTEWNQSICRDTTDGPAQQTACKLNILRVEVIKKSLTSLLYVCRMSDIFAEETHLLFHCFQYFKSFAWSKCALLSWCVL